MSLASRLVEVAGGRASIRVLEGGDGPALLYLHGAGGVAADDPFLNVLARQFRVSAPALPGFLDSEGGERLRNMLDITLLGHDILDALALHRPIVVGHSMGGMIAAEMAALAPHQIDRLVLIGSAGLWLDEHPIADLFALLPYQLPELLFHDPAKHAAMFSAGGDLNDPEFLTEFLVANHRRMTTAGKILFPIPDRGLAERLYRVRAETRIVWGASDRLIPPVYARKFAELLPGAAVTIIPEAGHMVPWEQPDAVADVIRTLHN